MSIPKQAGIGLRYPHYQQVLDEKPDIAWLEVHSENFFLSHSIAAAQLLTLREYYPLSMHGVGLSLGSADGLSQEHLLLLKNAIKCYEPSFVSEHLSWSRVGEVYFNDLLPLPYTEESLRNFCHNITVAQDFLGCQLLIENPSTYVAFSDSSIPEWDFYAELPKRTGCALLFDVNNIYVNSHNHSFDVLLYLHAVNPSDVREIHLAGFHINKHGSRQVIIDDHGSPVHEIVWSLYQKTIDLFGKKPTLIEWDSNIPELSVLLGEAKKAQTILNCSGA